MVVDFGSLRVASVSDTVLLSDSIPVRLDLVTILEDGKEEFDLSLI